MVEDWVVFIGMGVMAALFYVLAVQTVKASIKAETKKSMIDQVLTSIGFKNAKIRDLNDLSDLGFARLVTLLRETRQPAMAGTSAGWLNQLQALGQLAGSIPAQRPQSSQAQPEPLSQSPSDDET